MAAPGPSVGKRACGKPVKCTKEGEGSQWEAGGVVLGLLVGQRISLRKVALKRQTVNHLS